MLGIRQSPSVPLCKRGRKDEIASSVRPPRNDRVVFFRNGFADCRLGICRKTKISVTLNLFQGLFLDLCNRGEKEQMLR